MNKLQNIINEVVAGVRTTMQDQILSGSYGMHYEHICGDAYIDIDIFEENRGGYYVVIEQVMVSHVDTAHRSPLLEQAIKAVLPDWYEMKEELMDGGMRQTA